ncbi:type VII secretion-associated serine protease [Sphaerisporangium siamense]|uniref:Type VII secretion-associated serine protease mycosin n=1 Tax=Sphaerisporangium siamense TaxID=795645 RepID=A0A7W7D6M6_9ACTN|nr:S8 family serine peptidase [Sphaerisporangium siamense]MBB4701026.1 type VII secretion-associated serine protease mycosin [Sphaerisporangium siamense]GII85829.1 type VII secretion-associated serine protease [Sphaerisporangium siamense]
MLTPRAARDRRAARVLAVTALVASLAVPAVPARADQVRGSQAQVLRTLGLDAAWRITRGAGAKVAVLDSGVDPRHHDLAGSVVTGPDLTKGANPRGVAPSRLHGTYMASLIAGHGHGPGGADGVIGVAPAAKVLSVRVILEDDEPGFRDFNSEARFENVVARGIRYAVDQGVDVINLSISKDQPTRQERAAIRYAVSKGVVLVAAAGNDGAGRVTGPYSYPASLPGVISVAAADRGLRKASFSNRNSLVLVAAPGVDIYGAGPGDQYWVGRGTSQATALVSGVAALIKAKYPRMTPALVTQALTTGVVRHPPQGYDPGTGFGVVNAARALAEAARLSRHKHTAAGPGVQNPDLPVGAGGRAAEPVRVVRRDSHMIAVYGGVAAAAGALACTSLTALVILVRRGRRRRRREEASHPPAPSWERTPT